MKAIVLLAVALLALGTVQSKAQSAPATKKYLVLGADPQHKNRQPVAGKEQVVVLDDDICDSGWGSGSGKKIGGCYPAHSAAIANIETGEIVAMYVCGNEPSDKHRAIGKVVPTAELVLLTGPQGPPGRDGVDGKDASASPPSASLPPFGSNMPKETPAVAEHHGPSIGKILGTVGNLAWKAAAAYTIYQGGRYVASKIGGKKSSTGTEGGGNTGPAFGFGFGFGFAVH